MFGSLAQLVERHVYTVDVIGSIPVGPTTNPVVPGTSPEQRGFLSLPHWCRCSPPSAGIVSASAYLGRMEHVVLNTSPDGSPLAVISGGREWFVGAEPLRWFERVKWWESERRMPRGSGRVDIEVLRLQMRLGQNEDSELVTMELVRDGQGGNWRVREMAAVAA